MNKKAVDNIDGDARFTLSAAQATTATLTNGVKTHTTDWKGNLSTEVTLTWESADYRSQSGEAEQGYQRLEWQIRPASQ